MPPEPHGAHGEGGREGGRGEGEGGGGGGGRGEGGRETIMITKRELLSNLCNIYKCKVSPGGTFSLGNFLIDQREDYQV